MEVGSHGRLAKPLAAPLALFVVSACVAPRAPREGYSREWIEVFFASDDRRGSDENSVDDSGAWALEGGYNFVNTKHVDVGFEIGAVWSQHDVPQTDGTQTHPRLNVARYSLGGRVSLDFTPVNAVLWIDGGIYVRDEVSSTEPSYEQDGRGNYAGAGLDFWYDASGRMGPFVRTYDFADSDLSEVMVGLSVTFSI